MTALLTVDGLTTRFPMEGRRIAVVDEIGFEIHAGEVLALVGESGCGKSMTALSILRLIPRPGRVEDGSVRFLDRDLLDLSVPQMRQVRGHEIAMIFQEPMTSLNPVVTVGSQVIEAIRLHDSVSRSEARRRTRELFGRVGIPDPDERLDAYPHQLSGGLKQRVMIAMALSMRPKLLIADEPTTALDVTIQAQILELLRELQRELEMAILLISHDLGIVNELADRVAVMYAGRIVETGTREEVLSSPQHPYTQGLLRSMPARVVPGARLHEIEGVVPSPIDWPVGCRFTSRCPLAFSPCEQNLPEEERLSSSWRVWCHADSRERGAPVE